jgi:HAD superfamily hydrolase (TIGR01549 family)
VAETKIVFWDVYGTLIVAHRGDLDSLLRRQFELTAAFAETARRFSSPATLKQFLTAIQTHRQRRTVAHPEIRIEEVWRDLLPGASVERVREAALDFERRANPKRAQPEAAETLLELQRRGHRQGIISNAQFYTRIELAELLPSVFDPELIFLSCDLGVAKPDLTAFRLARDKVLPAECVMVGDSVENDIVPARQVGFAGIHFGGDISRLSQVLERM